MKGRRLFVIGLLLVCIILLVTATDALACPMCKAALASQDRGKGDWVGGFFWSILFMLSMPFVLLGSFSTYMYVLVRRARREQSERRVAVQPAGALAGSIVVGQ
jgi:hypothetical protein